MTEKPMPDHTHIRRLLPIDGDQLGQHLLRLDDDSRQLRFGSAVSDAFLLHYAEDLHRLDTLIYGCFVGDVLRGIGELRTPFGGDGTSAEIAFTVERGFQHRGIGSLLMKRVMTAARNWGMTQLSVYCLPANEPMRHLANKFGAGMHTDQGCLQGGIKAEPATAYSLFGETVQEAHGLVSAFWDQAGKWTEGTHK